MKVKYYFVIAEASARSEYEHSSISILDYRYKGGSKDTYNSLESIGRITFQRNKGEVRWYGMTYDIQADVHRPDHIATMAKIAKYIYDNRDSSDLQPEDVINLIGGERYIKSAVSTDWLPASMLGYRFYKVLRKTDGEYLTKIIAPSDVLAEKQLNKLVKTSLKNSGEVVLLFHGIV